MKREHLSGNRHGKTEESILALQTEVRRLAPFEHWVRQFGAHPDWCPGWEKGREAECTCGLKSLCEKAQKK